MTNAEMIPNRFARFAEARRKLSWIAARTAEGRKVYLQTYLKTIEISAKTLACLRATKHGLYVSRGKSWDNVDGCKISAR